MDFEKIFSHGFIERYGSEYVMCVEQFYYNFRKIADEKRNKVMKEYNDKVHELDECKIQCEKALDNINKGLTDNIYFEEYEKLKYLTARAEFEVKKMDCLRKRLDIDEGYIDRQIVNCILVKK